MPELWELPSITPLFNQTIVEGPRPGGPQRLPESTWMLKQTFSPSLMSPAQTATLTTNTRQLSALTRQPTPEPTRDPAPGPGPQPATEEPALQQPAAFQGTTEGARPPPQQATAAHQATLSGGGATLPSMLLRKPGK